MSVRGSRPHFMGRWRRERRALMAGCSARGVAAACVLLVMLSASAVAWAGDRAGRSAPGPSPRPATPGGAIAAALPTAVTAVDPGVSAISATLAGTVNPNGLPTSAHFEWGETRSYGNTTAAQQIDPNRGSQTVAATVNLKSGMTYHYRVVATGKGGTAFGADQRFSTTGGPGDATAVTVFAAMSFTSPGGVAIVGFAPGARGDIAPRYVISGSRTQLSDPVGLALDPRGDLFVADYLAGTVFEYPPGAHGNAGPIARITIPGANFQPGSVAVDGAGDLLATDYGAITFPVLRRFKLVNGVWNLAATVEGHQNGTFPGAAAFGPDRQALEADQDGHITDWGVDPDGHHLPEAMISGLNTGLSVPFGIAADAADSIFVVSRLTGAVSRFAPHARGNVGPLSTLQASGDSIALDPIDRLIVGRPRAAQIAMFGPGASGTTAPLSTIGGPLTLLGPMTAVAASPRLGVLTQSLPDATTGSPYTALLSATGGFGPYSWSIADPKSMPGGLSLSASGTLSGTPTDTGSFRVAITVRDRSNPAPIPLTVTRTLTVNAPVVPSVDVTDAARGTLSSFPLAATGNVAPSFALNGSDGLVGPAGVVVDSAGRVYATSSNTNAVEEFGPGAGAGAQPDRTIVGDQTGLTFPTAIALDGAGGIYVSNPPARSVTYYAPGATSNAVPARTISGPDTGLGDAESMTVNAHGDLWVANTDANTLTEYAPGASGDATPIATVSSPAFFNGPVGLAQDGAGRLLVTQRFGQAIDRIAPDANGITTPLAVIQGPDTGLSYPHGIDIDAQGRIVVSNEYPSSIETFPADAAGDAQPLQTIAGAATGLGSPAALAVLPPLSIQTRRLPVATVGQLYTFQLRAALGSAPYRWRVIRGRLPAGLRLTRGGMITGVSRAAGRPKLAVQIQDGSHPQMRATVNLTLVTRCPGNQRGRRCQTGAVRTVPATLRLVSCRRGRCRGRLTIRLRLLAGRSTVTLVKGHTIYGRGTPRRDRGHERVDVRLTRRLPPGTYVLRQHTAGNRTAVQLRVSHAIPG